MIIGFFFNDTATTEIYTLSLHDALPIWVCLYWDAAARPTVISVSPVASETRWRWKYLWAGTWLVSCGGPWVSGGSRAPSSPRSEEHTSELQSRQYLVCRLLLEKKKHITS